MQLADEARPSMVVCNLWSWPGGAPAAAAFGNLALRGQKQQGIGAWEPITAFIARCC